MQFIEDLINDVHFLKVAVWCLLIWNGLVVTCVAGFGLWLIRTAKNANEEES